MTTLTGGRVVLREFTRGDVDATHAFGSDPVATRYVDWGPNTVADTAAFLDRTLAQQGDPERDVYTLAVTLAASGALIGSCGVEVTDRANQRASMGYILHRDHWGHGYATETARLLVGFAFDGLGLHRLEATCRPENIASARVLEKAGLRREGHFRDHVRVRGAWHDSLLYAVIRSDVRRAPEDAE